MKRLSQLSKADQRRAQRNAGIAEGTVWRLPHGAAVLVQSNTKGAQAVEALRQSLLKEKQK